MERAQHVKEKAPLYDPRRRGILKKNKIQQKGSSKHVKSREKNKKKKRSGVGISSGSKIRGRTRKKMKFVLDDDGDDGPSSDNVHDRKEPDILILGERYCGTINIGNSSDSEEDSLKFVDSDNSNEDDIVFLSETDTNTVSMEDDIVFVREINTNTVRSADGFEWKEIESKESSEQGKDVEDSSERNLEENYTSESIQSEFATTSEQEVMEKRDEKQNDNAGTADSKLKNSTSRRKGKELSEFVDETSFDWSSESSPSIVAENNESDEFLSSSSSEPDDEDDEDFDIEHPYSSISEESFGSFEDEADEKDITTDADEHSIEEGSHIHGLNTREEVTVSIFQESDRRETANEMPEICDETKGSKENLCCDGVEEEQCSKCACKKVNEPFCRKQPCTGMKNQKKRKNRQDTNEILEKNHAPHCELLKESCSGERSVPISQEPDGRDNINEIPAIHEEIEGQKENLCCDNVHEAECLICSIVKGEDATISDEARKINIKKATKNEESNMRLMVEDPSQENSNCHHYETLETSPYSIGTCKNNEIAFSYKTNQKQKQSHLSKVLIESMLGRSGEGEEKSSEPELKESCKPKAEQSSSTQRTLPLKFRFEDEGSKPAEKSEYEIMVEDLFSEISTWIYSDMSDDSREGANEKPSSCSVKENKYHPCLEGLHELVIVEDIGEVCRRCNHVQREIKYLLPAFARIQGSAGRKCVDKGHFSVAADFTSSMNDFPKSSICTDGTVWDMIPGVKETMYQHQLDGFEFLWKNLEGTIDMAELKSPKASDVGGCIISHAPGTGKSRLTIVFIDTYLKIFPDARPVIIAPASMLLTWEEEFTKWKVEFPFHNLNNLELSGKEHNKLLGNISVGKSRDKFVRLVKMYSWNQEKSILGISYQLFEKLAGERHRRKKGNKKGQVKVVDQESENIRKILLEQPRLVVLDEGHTPRSQDSCIWNTLLKLQTERRIILSGTPFQNNFTELFNTFHLVRPTIASGLAKEKAFAEMIPSGGRRNQRMRLRHRGNSFTNSREEEAEKLIEMLKKRMAPFVHIHKGSILQKSLPGLKDCVILLNPPPQQKCLIEKIEPNQSTFQYEHEVALLSVHPSLFQKYLLSGKENSNVDMEMLTRLRRDPNAGIKTRFIMELVRRSKALNERVLIFSQYIEPLRLIKDQLIEHFGWGEGKQIFEMQGKLDQKLRQSFIEIFNNPTSEAQVLLASTRCCSEGINLVGASRIVLLDVVWNPSVERQAISRAYRLGQKKVVFTYHLMTSGTTEGEKYCRQAEKDRFSELVFTSTIKEDDKEKKPSPVFKDGILKEMIDNANLRDMFEKIIYQPKEANLVETFVSASLLLR